MRQLLFAIQRFGSLLFYLQDMNEFHEKYGQGVKSQDVRSDARKVS